MSRPNTVQAAAYDLKVFFTVVGKPADQVRPADVLAFITAQRTGRASAHGALRRQEHLGGLAAVRPPQSCDLWSGRYSRSRDLHARLGAIGPEQGEGHRRDARVSYVPNGRPRVGGKARVGDMVRDVPESRNIRDTPVARDIGQQPLARLEPGEPHRR